jgi:glycosyltransferase involved in cell wall biosynthesis
MRVRSCAVVVPARNEERLLGGCLTSIAVAQQQLRRTDATVHCQVIVVVDRCTDGTVDVLARHPEVQALHSTAGIVGAARRLGIAHALEHTDNPAGLWIACTDADSLVPSNWLVQQLSCAAQGAELVLGTVVPQDDELTASTFDEWLQLNPQRDGHPYVHGANLGIRADSYLRAGGFAPVAEHEDVLLAAAVRQSGGQVVSTAACPVATSGRRIGRTPGGFAGYLAALAN